VKTGVFTCGGGAAGTRRFPQDERSERGKIFSLSRRRRVDQKGLFFVLYDRFTFLYKFDKVT
jgi:hypothetical protein